jgi:hypothetical protein
MVKQVRQLKDPRSCSDRTGGLFLWGNEIPPPALKL